MKRTTMVGFGLVAVAVIGVALAFGNVKNYNPGGDLAWNMQHAGFVQRPDPILMYRNIDCSDPMTLALYNVTQYMCESYKQQALYEQPTYRLSLGNALVICLIVGLAGIGTALYGWRSA